jgi:hypothetical protein
MIHGNIRRAVSVQMLPWIITRRDRTSFCTCDQLAAPDSFAASFARRKAATVWPRSAEVT